MSSSDENDDKNHSSERARKRKRSSGTRGGSDTIWKNGSSPDARESRWIKLLYNRPAEGNESAMSQWLMSILNVSDPNTSLPSQSSSSAGGEGNAESSSSTSSTNHTGSPKSNESSGNTLTSKSSGSNNSGSGEGPTDWDGDIEVRIQKDVEKEEESLEEKETKKSGPTNDSEPDAGISQQQQQNRGHASASTNGEMAEPSKDTKIQGQTVPDKVKGEKKERTENNSCSLPPVSDGGGHENTTNDQSPDGFDRVSKRPRRNDGDVGR